MRTGISIVLVCLGVAVIEAKELHVPRDYATIGEAVRAASPGDTVLVANGTYVQSSPLKIDKAITLASRYILSKSESDIDRTVLRATASNLEEWVELAAADARIVGFKLIGNDEHTLNVTSPSGSVSHCKFIGGKDQLSITRGGGYIGYNYFENAGDDSIDCDHAVSWVIEHNRIVNAHQDGIEVRLHPKDAPLTKHIFRHNTVVGSGESGIQLIDYKGNSFREFHIHHNVFQGCKGSGVSSMYQEKDDTREVYRGSLMEERAFVFNNTFAGCNCGLTLSPGMVVVNNVFTGLRSRGIARGIYLNKSNDRSVVDYCLFYANALNFDAGVRLGSHILVDQDPMLDEAFGLRDRSPCIDAGAARLAAGEVVFEVPASEYTGQAPDLGALEYGRSRRSEPSR